MALRSSLRPVRPELLAMVEQFVGLFGGGHKHRRPMLVITGGTNTGKSLLAAEVLRRVASRVGVEASPGFLEITVEKSTALSLEDFDVARPCERRCGVNLRPMNWRSQDPGASKVTRT